MSVDLPHKFFCDIKLIPLNAVHNEWIHMDVWPYDIPIVNQIPLFCEHVVAALISIIPHHSFDEGQTEDVRGFARYKAEVWVFLGALVIEVVGLGEVGDLLESLFYGASDLGELDWF